MCVKIAWKQQISTAKTVEMLTVKCVVLFATDSSHEVIIVLYD